MKKLTAGIFTVLIGLCAANSADASVASTGWVEEQVSALATTVETNKTTAANATKAVSDALTEYKTSNDAVVALKAANADLQALQAKVGTLPEGSADVVAYINKKTEGIATDAALGELQTQVSGNTTAISTLNGSGEGSVAKSISDALASYTNTTDMTAAIKVVSDALDTHEATAASTYATIDSLNTANQAIAGLETSKEAVVNKLTSDNATQIDDSNKDTFYPTIGRVTAEIDKTVTQVNNDITALTAGLGTKADKATVEALTTTVGNNAATASQATAAVAKDLSDYQAANNAAVKANTDAIAEINDAEDGILAQAKAYAKDQADAASTSASGVATDLAGFKTTVSQTYATQEALGATNTNVTNLTGRVGTNETNIAANSTNITKNAENILANAKDIEAHTTAIAAAQAQADKGVADAAAAQSTANQAKATADAAIPKPQGECQDADNKCVLTYNNSTYTWEVIERSAEGK